MQQAVSLSYEGITLCRYHTLSSFFPGVCALILSTTDCLSLSAHTQKIPLIINVKIIHVHIWDKKILTTLIFLNSEDIVDNILF